ncbi:MAG: hypothetical protein LQ337_003796 [Flavoplaca oasis]|nr:MAG: hypothetical protein LQ337_003796 [Flavoplaca oasis]
MQCATAAPNSSGRLPGEGVPRIDSAIELVNLTHAKANDDQVKDACTTNTWLPSTNQEAQLHNVGKKLSDLTARREHAELSVRCVLLRYRATDPHALKIVEDALDQAIVAMSNLANKTLQNTLNDMTKSSDLSAHSEIAKTKDCQRTLDYEADPNQMTSTIDTPLKRHPNDGANPKHQGLSKTQSRVPTSSTPPAVTHFLQLQQRNTPRPVTPKPNTLAALWHKSPMPPPDSYKGHMRNLKQRIALRSATRSGLDLPHAPNGGLIPHSRYCYESYDPFDGFQCEVGDAWVKAEVMECVRWIGNLVIDYMAEKEGNGTKLKWKGKKDEWMFMEVMGKEGVLERLVEEVG